MFDYSNKFDELGYRPLKETLGAPSYNALSFIERARFKVPADYQEFLGVFPLSGVFDKNVIFSCIQSSPWASNGNEALEVIYGCCPDTNNDLMKVREQYLAQLPEHFFVIGQVTGSNLICLDMRSVSFGYVYLWDHEHLGDNQHGFYLIAKSFTAFVEALRLVDDRLPENGPKLLKMDLTEFLKGKIAEVLKNKEGKT